MVCLRMTICQKRLRQPKELEGDQKQQQNWRCKQSGLGRYHAIGFRLVQSGQTAGTLIKPASTNGPNELR